VNEWVLTFRLLISLIGLLRSKVVTAAPVADCTERSCHRFHESQLTMNRTGRVYDTLAPPRAPSPFHSLLTSPPFRNFVPGTGTRGPPGLCPPHCYATAHWPISLGPWRDFSQTVRSNGKVPVRAKPFAGKKYLYYQSWLLACLLVWLTRGVVGHKMPPKKSATIAWQCDCGLHKSQIHVDEIVTVQQNPLYIHCNHISLSNHLMNE